MGTLIDWKPDSFEFSELICRTYYSFLRGGSSPEEIVNRAIELGLPALGIVDWNGVYALPKVYHALQNAKKENEKLPYKERRRIPKLICGAEIAMEPFVASAMGAAKKQRQTQAQAQAQAQSKNKSDFGSSLIFYARDRVGYGLLCRLITESYRDQPKGEARLTWKALERLCLEEFYDASLGLICVPRLMEEDPQVKRGFHWDLLRELFQGRLYLPLGRFLDGKDAIRTDFILGLSRKWNLPVFATNDVAYHSKERRRLHDVLSCIREGVSLSEAGSLLHSNAERYLKSHVHMKELFSDLPKALEKTQSIVEACAFELSELRYQYPTEWVPKGMSSDAYLEQKVWEGAQRRYPRSVPLNVQAQIQHELNLVRKLQYADYFLTIWEIVDFARSKGILCQGRGSAANSAICYCLGITAVDPVRMGLLFERFISAERDEPPDIDVDFESERREEVIQYIYRRYGRDRAAMVSAVVTYRSKLAAREVNKAFGKKEEAELTPLSESIVKELRGFPRHLSIHSGGFTLSAGPVVEIVPVEPARMKDRTIIQWDKYDLDILGLLKVDVLSLGMLSAIQKCLTLLGNRYTFATIPAEDPDTYALLRRGDAVGLFQVESRAQINMLGRLQPKTFYDLVIEVAIVRPGPIVGKMVHPYLKRRDGKEPISMPHPKLVPILKKTLGVPIFQEQVMQMAISLAGFTPGESDQLRKAMGVWGTKGNVNAMGERLRRGLLQSGLPRGFVDQVFEQIKGFAEYGFPESHAASFALITYVSAYLKCHYPAEFICSVMNSQPMGFYTNYSLINDVKRRGVKVLPVDLNRSVWDSQIEPDQKGQSQIRLGFREVKGMSESEYEALSFQRSIREFESVIDFLSRVSLRAHILERLALGDVFREFGLDQRHALWEVLAHEDYLLAKASPKRQLGLFDAFSEMECFQNDYESFRLSLRGHPMQVYRAKLTKLFRLKTILTAQQIRSYEPQKHSKEPRVAVAGVAIVRQRPPTAKGVVFATIEDETGLVDLIFQKPVYERYHEWLHSQGLWLVEGLLQMDRHARSVLVKKVSPLLPEDRQVQIRPKHTYFSVPKPASEGQTVSMKRIDRI